MSSFVGNQQLHKFSLLAPYVRRINNYTTPCCLLIYVCINLFIKLNMSIIYFKIHVIISCFPTNKYNNVNYIKEYYLRGKKQKREMRKKIWNRGSYLQFCTKNERNEQLSTTRTLRTS